MLLFAPRAIALALCLLHLAPTFAADDDSDARRRAYLRDSLHLNEKKDHRHPISRQVTNHDDTWLDWQKRTGELPPDFSRMPATPLLPDPLVLRDGDTTRPVTTPFDWNRKRDQIRTDFQQWISGRVPPAPDNITSRILSERTDGEVRLQMVELNFGPGNRARMTFELLIPPGPGPHPVYMTQWNHRSWAQLAVQRGYIGCVYAGADSNDDTQAYQAIYPDYDFTGLMRRAWGASRVVDYLYTRSDVNTAQIAITGHSRNGKQAIWAGAFDERITAVIPSSCGTGGITPWRFSDPQFTNQTLDDIAANAAHWFHPRLRFFFGREDRLPIDQNELIALIAPRALLFHYSTIERQLNPWANEQCWRSVKTVYDFLGAPDRIGIFPRMGEHALAARDLERCLDFLDHQFGRNNLPWQNEFLYADRWEDWATSNSPLRAEAPLPVELSTSGTAPLSKETRAQIIENLKWLLGKTPPQVKPKAIDTGKSSSVDWIDDITQRPTLQRAKTLIIAPYATFGTHLGGTVYYPVNKDGTTRTLENGKIPVIITLHQFSYNHGYAYGYATQGSRGNSAQFQKLVDSGFAVFAFDMFGFGTRQAESLNFQKRFPEWSKLGKMVTDVSASVDAINQLPFLDSNRVYILGNTIGGTVGLMAAALDERINGVAAFAPFSPWRTSGPQYHAIEVISHQHNLLPRLGLFASEPAAVPIDLGEIAAAIAPRKLMIINPTLNRHSDPAATRAEMDKVKAAYDNATTTAFSISTPREINRLTNHDIDLATGFFTSANP